MRFRIVLVGLVTAAMATLGVGCTNEPPSSDQAQWLGNGIFMVIYSALRQANFGNCPFPLGPSDPPTAPSP